MAGRIARLIRCSEDADNAAIEPCACNLMCVCVLRGILCKYIALQCCFILDNVVFT